MGGGLNVVILVKQEGGDDEEERGDKEEVIVILIIWKAIYRHEDAKALRDNLLQTLQEDQRGIH